MIDGEILMVREENRMLNKSVRFRQSLQFTAIIKKCLATLLASVSLLCSTAWAWPDKSIELVVGFAAGGGTDITARTLAVHLSKKLGVPVVVSNKPGASGELGLAYVAKSAPDGYVIGMTNMPGLVTLPIERQTQYKASDFTYLANIVRDPSAFSVVADSPYQSLADLIAAAKKSPNQISYASTGVGTDDHLALVFFERLTGTQLNHVPFNGAGPLRNALFGGHVAVGGLNLGEVMPAKEKFKILGQASTQRSPLAPDVPTFTEQGIPLIMSSERGLVAPQGLSASIRDQYILALRAIAQDPEFQKQMTSQFTELDFVEGQAWKARLDRAAAEFSEVWKKTPWGDAQRSK